MKKLYVALFFLLAVSLSFQQLNAQISQGGTPVSFTLSNLSKNIDTRFVAAPDMEAVMMEDLENDGFGKNYRIGILMPVNLNPDNSGTWEQLPNGDFLWRLQLNLDGAVANSLYYDDFELPAGAKLFIYNPEQTEVFGAFTEFNNHESRLMSTSLVAGSAVVLELFVPAPLKENVYLNISEVSHTYRGFWTPDKDVNDDMTCYVNIKCPTADTWQDQSRGVARIESRIGTGTYLCTGSLVNTVSNSCEPYFLTADHCAHNGSVYATAANLNQWKFYFNYQATTCTGTTGSLTQSVTGCALRAHDTYGSGGNGSDFYLVLFNNSVPTTYQVYYNGWNKATTAATSGSSIHHPNGMIKKFSIFSTTLSNYTTHWGVTWANQPGYGHSVTYFGSSGSPIFNQSKLMVGTLTGGNSFCQTPTELDYYGKFSYHWQSNGTTNDKQLKPWLDPNNTNPASKTGTNYNACSGASVDEISAPNLNISLFPNPASDVLTLTFENYYFEKGVVRVIDVLGNVVATVDVAMYNTEIQIPVAHLANGIYYVHASNSDHSFSRSFMVAK